MKLGIFYNLFDCEELLETSILSMRQDVAHVCVVYQTTSNFGQKTSNPFFRDFLESLKSKGLIDSLVFYEPTMSWNKQDRERLISDFAYPEELGGSKAGVGDQFLNEVTKRELGRLDCQKAGCTHFISMDADEYYFTDQLKTAKQAILANGWESTACRMRIYGKFPTAEYCYDNLNGVPFIHALLPGKEFKLAARYPMKENGRLFALDPTRRVDRIDPEKFHFFDRSEIEMHHMTLVRKDITTKIKSVSNKMNYGDIDSFMQKWENWTPADGVLHPHPYVTQLFQSVKVVPNYFDIDIARQCFVCCKADNLMRCSACKRVRYCSEICQHYDWPRHENECEQ